MLDGAVDENGTSDISCGGVLSVMRNISTISFCLRRRHGGRVGGGPGGGGDGAIRFTSDPALGLASREINASSMTVVELDRAVVWPRPLFC